MTVQRAGPVFTVTLNRPQRRNALDLATWRRLHERLVRIAGHPSARVLVLTGAEGNFCSGTDLKAAASGHPMERLRTINDAVTVLRGLAIPTIAKVDGWAVSGGWGLALCCHVVATSDRALFISPRTVEYHLHKVFAKLGVSSRRELPIALRELGAMSRP